MKTIVYYPGLWTEAPRLVVEPAPEGPALVVEPTPAVGLNQPAGGNAIRLGGIRGRKLVSRATREARVEACRGCSLWSGETRFQLGHCTQCRVCGGTRIHAWLWASKCVRSTWPES